MTVGVYGFVAGIVKLDDLGLWLSRRGGAAASMGRAILAMAPWLMKGLSIAGTAAMFLVGGGILVHGLPPEDAAIPVRKGLDVITSNETLAAAELHLTASAISHQVARLEADLGVRLFERSAHGVRLSDAGERYLERVQEFIGAPIDMVSTGPDREHTILLRHPYQA